MKYLTVSEFLAQHIKSHQEQKTLVWEKKIHFLVIFMATRDNKIRRDMTGITTISLPRKEKEEKREEIDA